MTIYGYLRVSTEKQNENNFKPLILDYANNNKLGNVDWIQETISGRVKYEKRLLGQKYELMKKGDVIIMGEFSRIGRDFMNSLDFVAKCRDKGIRIVSLKGDIPEGNTATDNLILSLNAWKNQVEREMISYRTKEGLKRAKSEGKKIGGGHFKLNEKHLNEIQELYKNGSSLKFLCEKYKITYPTINRFLKMWNITRDNKI